MTPVEPNPDVVIRRLRMMRDALDTLDGFRGVDVAQLNDDPVARAAVERLLQVIVGLAFDINAHLVAKTLGRSPETGRASFHDLVEAGVLDEALAATLAPSAGLRNVLVHHYVDLRMDLIADAVRTVGDGFPAYITAVARYLDPS
ncbi:MAG: DUF86 domain-containing protein [Candidatus Microthrix subdominans]|jgi:uncharacterized protein YutE (UPF0331/DUF86 family)|uniref:DUF86 domain-containing protein n=1 Tax=Candidatus Neomicrothrix subdominans TaxID=2954438 RepID=A0A936TBN5_9ACTN|nr:DUF86 domain-containing protein [Candidatus Microthrix sp.]MBK9295571.1 DUF86 domain-containing protein [Candidatus Microthrix subdominans]MBK6438360.1 DUF86 domain-containing protein [Candidatus Microthrix sp.]MBK6970751.1 DUF86 domain-containing protein [Candidatus Microthrix sp.]MBK7165611.1 DUF86 domain-containing protein [Candidatus Microthrix sp.]MBP7594892.1 DUF86 domain-containing protein [Candidatus Microthrix sp.]